MGRPLPAFLRPLFVICAMVGAAIALPSGPAHAGSQNVVISQVYSTGGNNGATYSADFIELFNRGSVAVDLTGWSVQYAPGAGTIWAATMLSGTLPAGGYYLIQQPGSNSIGAALPAPDLVGTTALSSSAGKVALVSNGILSSGACPAGAALVDFVGYGSAATCAEGNLPSWTPSSTTSISRRAGGCTDSDDNSADFWIGAPGPRNSASAPNVCFNADLGGLSLSAGSLSPGFAGGIANYAAFVPGAVASITVTPTLANLNATVAVNGVQVASGSASAPVGLAPGGGNLIEVVVTAPDAVTKKTYTVALTRGAADLAIAISHSGNFARGRSGAAFSITVSNIGDLASDGSPVSVIDTLPAGLSAIGIGGSGWSCAVETLSCSRADVLGALASYPPIWLTVSVAGNAAARLVDSAGVSGGGELNTGNNTASNTVSTVPHLVPALLMLLD